MFEQQGGASRAQNPVGDFGYFEVGIDASVNTFQVAFCLELIDEIS